MGNAREKHPSWFKMKLERRELLRQLPPEASVNVLLACWEYLESRERPGGLSQIETIAFASFVPDIEEAWGRYAQRISARNYAKEESTDIGRYHTVSTETEEETEAETEEDIESRAAERPKRPHSFVPPTVEEVRAYCAERRNGIDAELFVDFYQARGWTVGKGRMKDWKAAVRTWESRDRADRPQKEPPPKAVRFTVDEYVRGGGGGNG